DLFDIPRLETLIAWPRKDLRTFRNRHVQFESVCPSQHHPRLDVRKAQIVQITTAGRADMRDRVESVPRHDLEARIPGQFLNVLDDLGARLAEKRDVTNLSAHGCWNHSSENNAGASTTCAPKEGRISTLSVDPPAKGGALKAGCTSAPSLSCQNKGMA